eukprot:86744_1
MGGMRPDASRPMDQTNKLQKIRSLDNTVLLDRTVVNQGNRKKKHSSINFDSLEHNRETSDDVFHIHMSSNANDETMETPLISAQNGTNSNPQILLNNHNESDHTIQNKTSNTNYTVTLSHTKPPDEKIIEVISKKDNLFHLRLFTEFNNYVAFRKGEQGKGIQIETFCDNKYGQTMGSLGVQIGWKVTKIRAQDVTKLKFFIIKNQLQHEARQCGKKGYDITLKKSVLLANIKVETDAQMKPQVVEPPKRSGLKCELVQKEKGIRVLRLFATFDKYIETKAGEKGKGMVVSGYIDYYIQELGVNIGWKLSKLGKKNVNKTSFIMLRNQLLAQSCIAKDGYELTFSDPTIPQSNKSQKKSKNTNARKHVNMEQEPQEMQPNSYKEYKDVQTDTQHESNRKRSNAKQNVDKENDDVDDIPDSPSEEDNNDPQPFWCYWYKLCL